MMLIKVGVQRNAKNRKYKPLLFFNLIPNIVFGSVIGIFFWLVLIASVLIVLFTQRTAYQLFFYSAIGLFVFLTSYLIYRHRYFHILKVPSYKSFIISRNKLVAWMWWTLNAWLLSCWGAMVCVGSFGGFSWAFPTSENQLVLTSEPSLTKLTGIVLWVVHFFLMALLSISYKKLIDFFKYGQAQLRNRKDQLKQFKLKAEEEVNVQSLSI